MLSYESVIKNACVSSMLYPNCDRGHITIIMLGTGYILCCL